MIAHVSVFFLICSIFSSFFQERDVTEVTSLLLKTQASRSEAGPEQVLRV